MKTTTTISCVSFDDFTMVLLELS